MLCLFVHYQRSSNAAALLIAATISLDVMSTNKSTSLNGATSLMAAASPLNTTSLNAIASPMPLCHSMPLHHQNHCITNGLPVTTTPSYLLHHVTSLCRITIHVVSLSAPQYPHQTSLSHQITSHH